MKSRYLVVLLILLALIGGGLFLFSSRNDKISSETEKLQKAPEFSLKDYEKNTVSLKDFSGKPVLINSWAVWCPFCVEELKEFAKVKRDLGDKIAIVAIDRAESLDKAKGFTDDLGISSDLVFLLDPSDSFYQSIGGFSMPETIFVNKDGQIVFHKRGPMSEKEIRQRIKNSFDL